ncbi:MAG: metallophosphoesterase [Desulfovibrionaceae bacterium]|nr:metallophosphoesterase [Desulfovibrionaceae bacterium]
MKIAIITDVHNGKSSINYPHLRDPKYSVVGAVEQFVDYATESGADLLLELGDRIDNAEHDTDLAVAKELAPVFARFPRKRVHIMGNHDVFHLSKKENEEIFDCSFDSHIIDLGELRLIAWQPRVNFDYELGCFSPTREHLAWLVRALLEDERPAIVASHVSPAGRAQTGNFYHHFHPTYSTFPDHEAIRAAVEKTGRLAIWMSGHSHWNTWTNIGGIHYFTIQSLPEQFTTYPKTAETHADLIIEKGQFTLQVHGNDPLYMRLPFQKSSERFWMPPIVRVGSGAAANVTFPAKQG